MKVSQKEGGKTVELWHEAGGRVPTAEVSTTFLKNATLCYMPQIPGNNKRVQHTSPQ